MIVIVSQEEEQSLEESPLEQMENCWRREILSVAGPRVGLRWRGSSFFWRWLLCSIFKMCCSAFAGFGGEDLHFLEVAALLHIQDVLFCFCGLRWRGSSFFWRWLLCSIFKMCCSAFAGFGGEDLHFFGGGCFAPYSRCAVLLLLTCPSYDGWFRGVSRLHTHTVSPVSVAKFTSDVPFLLSRWV